MSVDRRQVALLLGNALRMDFRVRNVGRERRSRNVRPMLAIVGTDLVVGAMLAVMLVRADVPLLARCVVAYLTTGLFLVLNLMTEYHEILDTSTDAEVLGWRPIDTRTLYVARVLHVLAYVGVLAVALLLPPCVALAIARSSAGPLVAAGFAIGGLLHALFVVALTIVTQGVLMRRLPAERFQDVLASVQLGAMLVIVLGFQLLAPEVVGAYLGKPLPTWIGILPAAWFASLPTFAAGLPARWFPAGLVLGLAGLTAVAVYALRRLAPNYAGDVEAVRMAAVIQPAQGRKLAWLQNAAGRVLGQAPLRRLGFDFFLAQLRGDRRVRVGMMPLVAIPVGLVAAAVVLSRGADPYAAAHSALPFATDPAQRGRTMYFMAVHMMVLLALASSRATNRSQDWRAGWIYYAAPLQRYDDLCLGVMWGVVYGLLLPAMTLIALVLVAVWRNPLHVAAHVAIPFGLALLSVAVAFRIDSSPPFSREPLRNERGRDTVIAMLCSVPLLVGAGVQYVLRSRPWILIATGAVLGLVAALVWVLVARHVRKSFPHSTFEA